ANKRIIRTTIREECSKQQLAVRGINDEPDNRLPYLDQPGPESGPDDPGTLLGDRGPADGGRGTDAGAGRLQRLRLVGQSGGAEGLPAVRKLPATLNPFAHGTLKSGKNGSVLVLYRGGHRPVRFGDSPAHRPGGVYKAAHRLHKPMEESMLG